jgi:arsenate reductase-like glutaredoxin family protein
VVLDQLVKNMRFKEFILIEQTNYLSEKIGDILTDTQRLRDESPHMGSRDLTRFSERIVKKIRNILHSSWPESNKKYLQQLSKIGANIMFAIDSSRKTTTPKDLPSIIAAVSSNLEKLVSDMGTPINKLGVDTDQEEQPESDDNNVSKSIKPQKPPQQKQDQKNNQPKDQSAAPPSPQTQDQVPNTGSPINADPQMLSAPGLGGSSGPLSGF